VGSAVLSFAVVAGMVTVVPGLDTSLVPRAAISHGRRAALTTAAGVNLGLLVWGVAAAAGVTALLTAARLAFDVVRLVGAAYLVGLGAAMLWGTFRWTSRSSEPAAVERLERRPPPSASATLVRAAASRETFQRVVDRLTGALLIGFGVKLAVSRSS
jgi:threonine/homoserine/homoserine lactone efflux protein